MEKTPVKLRKKKLQSGAYSLYLDIYKDGVRKYEFLKLYLNKGNSAEVKAANRAALEAANVILSKRLVEIQTSVAGILTNDIRNVKMSEYSQAVIEEKSNLDKDYVDGIRMAVQRWNEYAGINVKVCEITPKMLKGFVDYLRTCQDSHYRFGDDYQGQRHRGACRKPTDPERVAEVLRLTQEKVPQTEIARRLSLPRTTVQSIQRRASKESQERERKLLSDSSVNNYFARINTILNKAVKDGIIMRNPMTKLDSTQKPHAPESQREYLTIDEVQKLIATPMRDEVTKRMFLFGCFTGLRYSDIKRVTWGLIDRRRIEMDMKKTKRLVYVPLSDNAMKYLPERKNAKSRDKVFTGYPHSATANIHIKKWAKAAGINKEVSFHVSRHTFATLALTYGADLYTVSKLLGHTSIETTQIYAKIVDKKKEEAVNLIPQI